MKTIKSNIPTNSASRTVKLSPELLNSLVSNIERGDHQRCRGLIATELDINDALTEVSFHHLHGAYKNKNLDSNTIAKLLYNEDCLDRQQFLKVLGDVFGIHGRAAHTILKKAGYDS